MAISYTELFLKLKQLGRQKSEQEIITSHFVIYDGLSALEESVNKGVEKMLEENRSKFKEYLRFLGNLFTQKDKEYVLTFHDRDFLAFKINLLEGDMGQVVEMNKVIEFYSDAIVQVRYLNLMMMLQYKKEKSFLERKVRLFEDPYLKVVEIPRDREDKAAVKYVLSRYALDPVEERESGSDASEFISKQFDQRKRLFKDLENYDYRFFNESLLDQDSLRIFDYIVEDLVDLQSNKESSDEERDEIIATFFNLNEEIKSLYKINRWHLNIKKHLWDIFRPNADRFTDFYPYDMLVYEMAKRAVLLSKSNLSQLVRNFQEMNQAIVYTRYEYTFKDTTRQWMNLMFQSLLDLEVKRRYDGTHKSIIEIYRLNENLMETIWYSFPELFSETTARSEYFGAFANRHDLEANQPTVELPTPDDVLKTTPLRQESGLPVSQLFQIAVDQHISPSENPIIEGEGPGDHDLSKYTDILNQQGPEERLVMKPYAPEGESPPINPVSEDVVEKPSVENQYVDLLSGILDNTTSPDGPGVAILLSA